MEYRLLEKADLRNYFPPHCLRCGAWGQVKYGNYWYCCTCWDWGYRGTPIRPPGALTHGELTQAYKDSLEPFPWTIEEIVMEYLHKYRCTLGDLEAVVSTRNEGGIPLATLQSALSAVASDAIPESALVTIATPLQPNVQVTIEAVLSAAIHYEGTAGSLADASAGT